MLGGGWVSGLLPHLICFFFLPVFFFLVTLDGSDWERLVKAAGTDTEGNEVGWVSS